MLKQDMSMEHMYIFASQIPFTLLVQWILADIPLLFHLTIRLAIDVFTLPVSEVDDQLDHQIGY